jgi:NADH-quinone oxidoreductase subunit N
MSGIIIISILALVVLFLGLYKQNQLIVPTAIIGLSAAVITYATAWNTNTYYFNQMMFIDNFAISFSILCVGITMFVLLLSPGYFERISTNVAEYVALILFALVGVLCMVGYNDLSMLFIGIEIMSVSMYIMTGIRKRDLISNEAALKYFLMGSFATGFLLLGIALVYGFTGSFNLDSINSVTAGSSGDMAPLFVAGILLMVIGLSFKVSAAPFHFWAPDVYDGAPSLVTAFMSSVVKTASFAAFLRLFLYALSASIFSVTATLWAITLLTIIVGNVIALYQTSFKRMLAYSSISHAGYMMMAILSLGPDSGNAVFIYAAAYSIATIIAFGVLIRVKAMRNSEDFDAFNGLGKTNPLAAFALTVAMCSLAGIPLTAGFFGKFFIFTTTIAQHYYWLVAITIINATIGIWYYFRVVIAMYMKNGITSEKVSFSLNYKIVLWIATALTIFLGLYPSLLSSLF